VQDLTPLRSWLLTGELPPPANSAEGRAWVAAAVEQGLAGLLNEHVVRHEVAWPADCAAELRQAHRAALARSVRQFETAGRVLRHLEAAGLRGLPLKGAAVAESLYDSVADRPMGDVDLLVLDDFAAAIRTLGEAGYRTKDTSDHAFALVDPDTGVVVELHRRLTSCGGLFPVDAEGLWARSRRALGQVPRLPSPEDLLIQLALHAAFQHGLVLRLVQWLDFRRLFERTPPAFEALLDSARRARAEAALALALEAAAVVSGFAPPASLRQALAVHVPPSLGEWLARRARAPLRLVVPETPDLLRVRWALARGRRWALLRGALGTPDPTRPAWRRFGRSAARAASLAWRWGAPAGLR